MHYDCLNRFVFKIKMPSDVRVHLINDLADIEYVHMPSYAFHLNLLSTRLPKQKKNYVLTTQISILCWCKTEETLGNIFNAAFWSPCGCKGDGAVIYHVSLCILRIFLILKLTGSIGLGLSETYMGAYSL